MKNILRKIYRLIKYPNRGLARIFMVFSSFLKDEQYLKILFRLRVGYKLNLTHPKTYNEKLQWLKLNYQNKLLTKLVDKYEAKNYVKKLIGDKFIIPTINVWDSFDKINFNDLPNQFVLKTTHDQGGVVICDNKNTFKIAKAKKIINKHLKTNHFLLSREWPYKNVKPRIIAEKYMIDGENKELPDYKIFCFDGIPRALFIATERQTGDVKFDFYDINFNYLDFTQIHKQSNKTLEKPKNFNQMIELSKILSKGLPHVRIDFYNINGKIYFGEFTFFHHGGLEPFHPSKWDKTFGDWIKLPNLS